MGRGAGVSTDWSMASPYFFIEFYPIKPARWSSSLENTIHRARSRANSHDGQHRWLIPWAKSTLSGLVSFSWLVERTRARWKRAKTLGNWIRSDVNCKILVNNEAKFRDTFERVCHKENPVSVGLEAQSLLRGKSRFGEIDARLTGHTVVNALM